MVDVIFSSVSITHNNQQIKMRTSFGHVDAASATSNELSETLANLVRTNSVETFLNEDGKAFLVGAKGVGKSLLLLKKAIEKLKNKSLVVIPNDNVFPVDRLTCDGHPGLKFHQSQVGSPSAIPNWTLVWKHSILKSVLMNYADRAGNIAENRLIDVSKSDSYPKDYADQMRVRYNRALTDIVGTPPYFHSRAPFYFYQESVSKLDDNPVAILEKLKGEMGVIIDTLSLVNAGAYIFIDNIDTYYELAPELWLASTIGLLHAIREIRLTLRHVHIYSSIRSDILSKYRSEKRLQFRDYLCFLEYSKEDLLEIFTRPIRHFPPDLLTTARLLQIDPLIAFFGEHHTHIQNWRCNGRTESIREYVLRHTLWRPRDLVAMGNYILQEKGGHALTPETIRRGLELAVKEIRASYLMEIQPSIPNGFEVETFAQSILKKNIISDDEIDKISSEETTSDHLAGMKPCCARHLFCLLYRVGLLAYLKTETTTPRSFFYFSRSGEMLIQDDAQHLPESSHYALHPILDEILPKGGVNDSVIVGHGIDVNRSKLP